MEQLELTVKQLNMYVRSLLEGDKNLASINLVGELSNFKNHYSSGHWYFVLKDRDAAVRCVMFKANADRVNFTPEDGMQVVLRGYVSLYEKDGQFQFYAETMRPFGKGDLAAEFERVKAKLLAEGLFDTENKRPIPKFPAKIGVITSASGAALQDILNILSRRCPITEVVIFPATVQGETAAESLIKALKKAYLRSDLELIIIGRGGGSAEDLSCFNNELLARYLKLSPVPTISAVGHETDFTICDFVADLRAPTPSAAAELSAPDLVRLCENAADLNKRCKNAITQTLSDAQFKVNSYKSRRCFVKPELIFAPFELRVDNAIDKLTTAYLLKIKGAEAKTQKLTAGFKALSPLAVLKRGYSVAIKNGTAVTDAATLSLNDRIEIKFARGSALCSVVNTLVEEEN